MKKGWLPFSLLLLISCVLWNSPVRKTIMPRQETHENGSAEHSGIDKSSDEDFGLGGGAYVEWAQNGWGVMDANGESPVATVVFHGAENYDLKVQIEFLATIGSVDRMIMTQPFTLAAKEERDETLDLRSLTQVHPKQLEYTLNIQARAVVLSGEENKRRNIQSLEHRYLAYNPSSLLWEVMDFETREYLYPYGFTTEEGQDRVRKILSEAPEDEFIEAIGPGI